jgi:hypothetical protein
MAGAGGAGGAAGSGMPFSQYLVLQLETDNPNGLQNNGAWRDLAPAAHTITVATGTPLTQAIGSAGARAMVFTATGPVFQVADAADLHFGATDDFLVVARATVSVPLETGTGCSFHYLFSKYAADASTGPTLRVCPLSTGQELDGSLQAMLQVEADVPVPVTFSLASGVVSFGRNLSGTRIETFVGSASKTVNITPIDVSASGSPFVIGGAGSGTTTYGYYVGTINRLYVFHAPAGTFAPTDFATIRTFVANAQPLP